MALPSIEESLPQRKDLVFYNGSWHVPKSNVYQETYNPSTDEVISKIAVAGPEDVDAAVNSAHSAFKKWRTTSPSQRANYLRRAADVLRSHASELALIDALNTGNPVAEMLSDANVAAASLDYFAGLIPMLKGETIPISEETFHYTLREPLGVVARIVAFNHPVMFAGAKMAAPLAAGNTVIIKPPEQAPLSCLKLAEILTDIFPPGVLSILPGGAECGKALTTHPLVKKVTLIGSVPTGKAIQRAAAESLKPTLLELGGKNALIAFPDADPDKLVEGISRGMNFTWAGQSCGSTSRVFLHESHHDTILSHVVDFITKTYQPGNPLDMTTTMGPVINKTAHSRILSIINDAQTEGATLLLGGTPPPPSTLSLHHHSPSLQNGHFILPTIFTNVNPKMFIAREEIFGPVMSVLKWNNTTDLIEMVNNTTPYGLTASIYTRDFTTAQKIIKDLDVGYIWVNQVGKHFLGVPFGGNKESGAGREECLDELYSFTQWKSVNFAL